jgi:hypothetical protein
VEHNAVAPFGKQRIVRGEPKNDGKSGSFPPLVLFPASAPHPSQIERNYCILYGCMRLVERLKERFPQLRRVLHKQSAYPLIAVPF